MKLTQTVAILAAFSLPLTSVHAEALNGCAAKKQDIEKKLQSAQMRGNQNQISGLEKALIENTAYCNDFILQQDKVKDIMEKQEKVEKRQAELQQAQQQRDSSKILKKQEKLTNAQHELEEAKRALGNR